MNPPTTRCLLENDLLRLELDQDVGASIADLAIKGPRDHWWPLLRRSPAIVPGGEQTASYLLAPWSNRIRDGKFRFEGRDYQVRVNWPDGTAIHGDVRDRAWTILDRSPISARLELDSRTQQDVNWPWSFRARVRYELTEAGMEAELRVANTDDSSMPVGGGFHPFFNRILWDVRDDPRVTAAVTGRYPCERVMVIAPAKLDDFSRALTRGTPLHEPLDDIFDCPTGAASIHWPASGVTVDFESTQLFKHLVIFCPIRENGSPYPFFCVEPVSMVNDGFNLAAAGSVPSHGVQVLAPGEEIVLGWKMRVRKD